MEKVKIDNLINTFNEKSMKIDEVECWSARELKDLLGYKDWRNFEFVINKAKDSAKHQGEKELDHFVDVNKMVEIGSNTKKEVNDVLLTRYACYLIAQNGDSRKEEIAFAQGYFAVQTRKQELIEERISLQERLNAREELTNEEKILSSLIYERGVDSKGFSRIRAKGDEALFGGYNTKEMKEKYEVPEGRALADFLPSISITAKKLAAEMTNHNVKQKDLYGENDITKEHVSNNKGVRDLLNSRGIKPEKLEPSEDLRKVKTKVNKEGKNISKTSTKFKNKNKETDR